MVAITGTLLFLSAMDRDLNHDEHQFIAPGALFSQHGQLPYREYPIFHLPNLVFVYGAIDFFLHDPVLAGKLTSVAATTGLAALLVTAAFGTTSAVARRNSAYWLAGCALVLLLGDQLFVFTVGKTWNHELPAFLVVAGIMAQAAAVRTRGLGLLGLSGLCVGAAIGTRLTYAPVALVFLPMLYVAQWERGLLWKGVAFWLLGCLVGLGPTIYFLCATPEAFIFDNLHFPRVRLLDAADTRVQKTASLWRKLRYFVKEIVMHSLPLFVAAVLVTWRPLQEWWRTRGPEYYLLLLTVLALPAALIGCFLPSRYQYQHYYVVAPLLALLIAASARHWKAKGSWLRSPAPALALCVLLSLVSFNTDPGKRTAGARAYADVLKMLDHREWFTTRLRADNSFAAKVPGRILTLAPAGVLQGGGATYPEFATGPFAWRGAQRVEADKRRKFKLVVPEDLEGFLAGQQPAGILTGVEDAPLEKPLVAYAEAHGYQATKVGKKRVLWVRQGQ